MWNLQITQSYNTIIWIRLAVDPNSGKQPGGGYSLYLVDTDDHHVFSKGVVNGNFKIYKNIKPVFVRV